MEIRIDPGKGWPQKRRNSRRLQSGKGKTPQKKGSGTFKDILDKELSRYRGAS